GAGAEVGDYRVVAAIPVVLRLVLERGTQAGPQLAVAEEPVDDGRRPPRRGSAFEVGGEPLGVSPTVGWLGAADAGDGAGLRPPRVPEELLSQRDLLGRGWVVLGLECRLLLESERQYPPGLGALGDGERDDHDESGERDPPPLHVFLLQLGIG